MRRWAGGLLGVDHATTRGPRVGEKNPAVGYLAARPCTLSGSRGNHRLHQGPAPPPAASHVITDIAACAGDTCGCPLVTTETIVGTEDRTVSTVHEHTGEVVTDRTVAVRDDAGMTAPTEPVDMTPDLAESRRQIDVLDDRLIEVLADRARVVAGVVRYKRAHDLGVVDQTREDRVLDDVERRADQVGLDPRIARKVIRAVIDAFTLVEDEQLDPHSDPNS